MCVFFQVSGYWLSGGEDVVGLLKEYMTLYLEIAGAGFILGLVLWFLMFVDPPRIGDRPRLVHQWILVV